MIESGLLSITFRKLTVSQIISLAAEAKLASIEWGGDVHVPHGDVATAAEVARQTNDAGLRISAYGSYYRAVAGGPAFEAVLDSASALGADVIRIWAGAAGSAEVSAADRAAIVADIARCCDLAAARGVSVAMEFHRNTLSDEVESALSLIKAVGRPNFGTFWQPPVAMPTPLALDGLRRMLPHVLNLHVFHWWPDATTRLPLADGADRWAEYFALATTSPRVRFASLEFVANDDVDRFRHDAATLRRWLTNL